MPAWVEVWLVVSAKTLLGLLLLWTGGSKAISFPYFLRVVGDYRLVPSGLVLPASFVIVGSELVIGATLFAGVPVLPEAAASVLFIVFGVAVAANLARGRSNIDCGCFGSLKQQLSWWLVARNLLLALTAYACMAATSSLGLTSYSNFRTSPGLAGILSGIAIGGSISIFVVVRRALATTRSES